MRAATEPIRAELDEATADRLPRSDGDKYGKD
jgi:hypothetical protein